MSIKCRFNVFNYKCLWNFTFFGVVSISFSKNTVVNNNQYFMSTFNYMFENMPVYICTCMIFNCFQYSSCSLSDIVFRTISFRTETMVNNIVVMFEFFLSFTWKPVINLHPVKANFLLILVGNKVFILFFLDLMTKSPFSLSYDTSKRCCFTSLTFLSSTTSFKFTFVLVMSKSFRYVRHGTVLVFV